MCTASPCMAQHAVTAGEAEVSHRAEAENTIFRGSLKRSSYRHRSCQKETKRGWAPRSSPDLGRQALQNKYR